MTDTIVTGINALAARWAGRLSGGSAVLSAAGVWPLLGFLAEAAAPDARTELAEAMGVPPPQVRAAADTALSLLTEIPEVRSALGLWARKELLLHPDWVTGLPPGVLGELTGDPAVDTATLDAWVTDHTGGLIDAMPLTIDPQTLLVLATALSVRTRWREPFTDTPWWIQEGPWAAADALHGLGPTTTDTARLRVAGTDAGLVTVLQVPGDGEIDVHLFLGSADGTAAQVLPAGLGLLAPGKGPEPGADAAALALGAPGPGVLVQDEPAWDPAPRLSVHLPAFTLGASHDLLAHADLFGLASTTGTALDRFPATGPTPLTVSQARQTATATFSARGFEAAAVTAVGMVAGAAPVQPPHLARHVHVILDRPFGFAAVHAPTGLVLVCGWVSRPQRYQDAHSPR
jgi:hypothetical protein